MVLHELREFRSFRTIAKVFRPTNKFQKLIFHGNSFPNRTIFLIPINFFIHNYIIHKKKQKFEIVSKKLFIHTVIY